MSHSCLQLKGSVVTTFILELYQYSTDEFTRQLKHKINQAPAFFKQSPVVISLEKLQGEISLSELAELVDICKRNNLQPMAIRTADEQYREVIQKAGLVYLSASASRSVKQPVSATDNVPESVNVADNKQPENLPAVKTLSRESKIITRPVRSGQQVYAQGADLIILSQVSEGAEVLADGHIHIYGSLRGRALAGVKGDETARVFCKSLEAELISIAGNFMLSDALRDKVWKQSAQVYLEENTLHVAAV